MVGVVTMVPSAITGAVVSVLSLFVFLHPVKKDV